MKAMRILLSNCSSILTYLVKQPKLRDISFLKRNSRQFVAIKAPCLGIMLVCVVLVVGAAPHWCDAHQLPRNEEGKSSSVLRDHIQLL